VSFVGEPDSLYRGRHEYRRFGCFIDLKPESPRNPNAASVVDAVEFWNDGEANVACARLSDVDVLRSPGLWVKAFPESKNAANPSMDGSSISTFSWVAAIQSTRLNKSSVISLKARSSEDHR
jgi:hypothetical protein